MLQLGVVLRMVALQEEMEHASAASEEEDVVEPQLWQAIGISDGFEHIVNPQVDTSRQTTCIPCVPSQNRHCCWQ